MGLFTDVPHFPRLAISARLSRCEHGVSDANCLIEGTRGCWSVIGLDWNLAHLFSLCFDSFAHLDFLPAIASDLPRCTWHSPKVWNLFAAGVLRIGTTSSVGAPRRWIQEAWKISSCESLGITQPSSCIAVGLRYRCNQALGVRVVRPCEQFVGWAFFNDPSEIHDGYTIAYVPDYSQVMRYEDEGDTEILLQFPQKIDDLGLYRDIQSRNGLVANDEFRFRDQGSPDRYPLLLTTTHLNGSTGHELRVQPNSLKHLMGPARSL